MYHVFPEAGKPGVAAVTGHSLPLQGHVTVALLPALNCVSLASVELGWSHQGRKVRLFKILTFYLENFSSSQKKLGLMDTHVLTTSTYRVPLRVLADFSRSLGVETVEGHDQTGSAARGLCCHHLVA